MSLLMQALKKAERAKQNSLHEEDVEKPSEGLDDLLTPPAATPPPQVPATAPLPAGGLSLEPLDDRPAPPAQQRQRHQREQQEEREIEDIPELIPATEAIHDPTPPQSRIEPAQKPKHAAPGASAATERETANPPRARVDAPATTEPSTRSTTSGAAARARAAASAAPDKAGWDPARIRIAILGGIMLLILAVFAYLYRQAITAPGAGSNLPMVPMPPPNASNAVPAIVVQAQPGAADPATAGQLPSASPVPAAPPVAQPAPYIAEPPRQMAGARTPSDDDIQRQLAEASQETVAPRPASATPAPMAAAAPPPPPQERRQPAQPLRGGAAANDGGGDIHIKRTAVAPTISPPLQEGYRSYLAGDFNAAAQHYENALRLDPNNRDALLGAASVAVRRNQGQQAAATYVRLLELDPNDADAMAGLIGMRPGDAGQSELRLKAILQKSPDAGTVLFALGNLYARQGRWPDAQQMYFRAYTATPDNADYAYNLAVGLDRLNQPKLALDYYRRALALGGANVSFDVDAVQARMQALAATGAAPN